jgi:hypothetical protein
VEHVFASFLSALFVLIVFYAYNPWFILRLYRVRRPPPAVMAAAHGKSHCDPLSGDGTIE